MLANTLLLAQSDRAIAALPRERFSIEFGNNQHIKKNSFDLSDPQNFTLSLWRRFPVVLYVARHSTITEISQNNIRLLFSISRYNEFYANATYNTPRYYVTRWHNPNIRQNPSRYDHFVFSLQSNRNQFLIYYNGQPQPSTYFRDVDLTFGSLRNKSLARFNGLNKTLLSEIHLIDGQALDASAFGEMHDGHWQPKPYTGSHGPNGFYLNFADASNLGHDVSGNNNHFELFGGINAANQSTNVPS